MKKMIITITQDDSDNSSSFKFKGDDLPLKFVSWAVSHLTETFKKSQNLTNSIKEILK